MIEQIKKFIDPLHRRLMVSIARGVIEAINDEPGIQKIQLSVLADELRESVERFQEYGFTSVPHEGAEALVLRVGGSCDHGIIVAVDDKRYRIKALEKGEVAIYTDEGDFIKLGRNNQITIHSDTKITIQANTIQLEDANGGNTAAIVVKGSLTATGNITDTSATNSRSMAGMRSVYNSHTHTETGTTTNAPSSTM